DLGEVKPLRLKVDVHGVNTKPTLRSEFSHSIPKTLLPEWITECYLQDGIPLILVPP
ncbi:hypothetical protein KUCAC02_019533, partial [Chaenocephalus aceratus]